MPSPFTLGLRGHSGVPGVLRLIGAVRLDHGDLVSSGGGDVRHTIPGSPVAYALTVSNYRSRRGIGFVFIDIGRRLLRRGNSQFGVAGIGSRRTLNRQRPKGGRGVHIDDRNTIQILRKQVMPMMAKLSDTAVW